MNRIVICHSHNDIKVLKFITDYIIPKASRYDFKTMFSELGNYSTIKPLIPVQLPTYTNDSKFYGVRAANKIKSAETNKFYRTEMFPALIKNDFEVQDISFLAIKGLDYTKMGNIKSKEYKMRDELMFQEVFGKNSYSETNALVLAGLGHCSSWWLRHQYEIGEKAFFVAVFSVGIHKKSCELYVKQDPSITFQECIQIRAKYLIQFIDDTFKEEVLVCTLRDDSSAQKCSDTIFFNYEYYTDNHIDLVGEQYTHEVL